ncbi:Guanine nucleotide exchange factor DBS [Labeo rohita]|uniref:Guanine nucleotide exchange factor DBS n=1 Tax=Labeo rohita TaxID=84645 RepID=A0ABQ8MZH5_LABRO|nr:Guanine nucleotide exchange factor DBS [Labeo rohita]
MQQESSPLCAADISPDLRKQFAFLSGGRGQNGSPIIIFPEYPGFGELEEQEFHNVLTYLTSVPRSGEQTFLRKTAGGREGGQGGGIERREKG